MLNAVILMNEAVQGAEESTGGITEFRPYLVGLLALVILLLLLFLVTRLNVDR